LAAPKVNFAYLPLTYAATIRVVLAQAGMRGLFFRGVSVCLSVFLRASCTLAAGRGERGEGREGGVGWVVCVGVGVGGLRTCASSDLRS
jgi:hypothetical protein